MVTNLKESKFWPSSRVKKATLFARKRREMSSTREEEGE